MPGKKTKLRVYVGTPGLGDEAFAWCTASEVVPKHAWLPVEIEYPNKDPRGKPVLTAVTIPPDDCGGNAFEGWVHVPRETGQGKAKITLAFPETWRAKVAPASFELPIEEPEAE